MQKRQAHSDEADNHGRDGGEEGPTDIVVGSLLPEPCASASSPSQRNAACRFGSSVKPLPLLSASRSCAAPMRLNSANDIVAINISRHGSTGAGRGHPKWCRK